MTLWAKVFRNHKGDRYFIPNFSWDDDESVPSSQQITPYTRESEVIIDAMTFSVILNQQMEPGAKEMPRDTDGNVDLPHVAMLLHSPKLQHGAVKVYVFEGPTFDEVLKSEGLIRGIE